MMCWSTGQRRIKNGKITMTKQVDTVGATAMDSSNSGDGVVNDDNSFSSDDIGNFLNSLGYNFLNSHF